MAYLFVILGLIFAGCQQQASVEQVETTESLPVFEGGEVSQAIEEPLVFTYEAVLEDLTGGEAEGRVQVAMEEGVYSLLATFSSLPPLEEGYFYEGWVVRQSPLSVVSTGALVNEDGETYANVFNSETDYADHLQYVLTLEPDDGDPAPAEHVMEGELVEI